MFLLPDLASVHAVAAQHAPIDGISMPDLADPSTWVITFKPEATEAQRAAAVAAIAGWDLSAPPSPVAVPSDGKAEARRRLLAVLKDKATQSNLDALHAALIGRRVLGDASQSDLADLVTLAARPTWVEATLAKGRALAAAGATDFGTDEDWPAPPPGLAALVARY